MYAFLFKPRWLALHVAALILAVLFVNFGFWQVRRLSQRRTTNALISERVSATAAPLADLIGRDDALYRNTVVSGRYDAANELLQRTANNYNGEAGYYLLTPLILEDGRALLVRRGWVPFELNEPPVAEATPPAGEVTTSGELLEAYRRPTGPLAWLSPRDPPGELDIAFYVNTDRLETQLSYELLPYYLELREQIPATDSRLPLPNLPLELSEGSHLGYAIQWFTFALIGVVGYVLVLRQVAQSRDEQTDEQAA